MIKEKDLLEKFRNYLYSNYPDKKELVSRLANILKMERESVLRRLRGNVQFTVGETGMIARALDISIDYLITGKTESILFSMDLLMPSNIDSMDSLIKELDASRSMIKKISGRPLHAGYIFDSLPIEFYAPHEHLSKFMYYKWAYYFTDENFRMDFPNWQIPQEIKEIQEEIIGYRKYFESMFYIWDNPVVPTLIRDMETLYKMRIINEGDIALIKSDLHHMLNDIEMDINSRSSNDNEKGELFDLYVSDINIGVSCGYFSPDCPLIHYKLPFTRTLLHENPEGCNKIYKWVNSMKTVSTLISGSGTIDRRIFFDKQHKIVERVCHK